MRHVPDWPSHSCAVTICRNLSFCIVEWPEFQVFCQTLNSQSRQHIVAAHSSVPELIDLWQEKKDIIRRKVQSAFSSIHLSLDIWTSTNSHLFLSIVSHFTNQEDNLYKALFGLPTVGDHSGEEQCRVLLSVFEDHGIFDNLGVIISDNVTIVTVSSSMMPDEV